MKNKNSKKYVELKLTLNKVSEERNLLLDIIEQNIDKIVNTLPSSVVNLIITKNIIRNRI